MKKILMTLALMLTIGIGASMAQIVTDSWEAGLGLSYPRMYSVNITSLNSDVGFFLALQRNFSEHVGVRLQGSYAHMNGQWTDASFNLIKETTSLTTGDLDLLFNIVPCAPVSPYLFAGVGMNYKGITNPQTAYPDNNKFGSQLNIGVGADYKINSDWRAGAEFGYHVTNNSELEGTIVPTEMNGHDSYLVLSLGIHYLFGKGKPSIQCETCPCQSVTPEMKDKTDYDKIEALIVKHIPKEVTKETIKEAVCDRYILAFKDDKLVLVGVKFAFDKSDILPESRELLDRSVDLLNTKPDAKFEVEGYTDYIGTNAYNQQLSVERAQSVKAYLVSKGIEQNRLTCVGFGKNDPVEDNATAEGRAQNRRIVFKIIK